MLRGILSARSIAEELVSVKQFLATSRGPLGRDDMVVLRNHTFHDDDLYIILCYELFWRWVGTGTLSPVNESRIPLSMKGYGSLTRSAFGIERRHDQSEHMLSSALFPMTK